MLHLSPVYPSTQVQEKSFTKSSHHPPFSQGVNAQSSISVQKHVCMKLHEATFSSWKHW